MLATAPSTMSAVLAALVDPATYPHATDGLELRETERSWVALAGPYAYKARKPITADTLDLSTPGARELACIAEVRLNRRFSVDIYRGVEWLVERDGRLRIGGVGRRVEPFVRMRRLPDAGRLTRMVEERRVEPRTVQRIAAHLVRLHARFQAREPTVATGSRDRNDRAALALDPERPKGSRAHSDGARAARVRWRQTIELARPFLGWTLRRAAFEPVMRFVERESFAQHALLERRAADGRVLECHGDLGIDAICFEGERIHLLDALDLPPQARRGDIAEDIAALVVDLDHHGLAHLSERLVDFYALESGDRQLARLLPLLCCCRAFARGAALSLRLDDPMLGSIDSQQALDIALEATAYFDLAWAYAGALDPTVVLVQSVSSSERDECARDIAARLGLVRASDDRHGVDGDRAACRRAARWLHRGRGIVLEAAPGDSHAEDASRRLAARLGVPFRLIRPAASVDWVDPLVRG